ncbi:hypothetical protein PC129_g14831 [Phytophthora cactorum]|uniref:Uncharacterized protein n=1 Tax=Phytophthora cactorum TaxID=29920 RepID=A0A329RQL5_9STRA|nr:hypothetical protein Pcac1_g28567 [Phytophthora cactorum]KAG2809464.1 hypothetical protein PC112_g16490 [Phytophthora cactorum]KAG2811092.1 hypothetical protein PC111_g15369 [Phytophthora cactorum]KAG2850751.1 hypothetical protein PC113_g16514 [Phytophthora cactorum]KAG2889301.1 hypothetical protein PC114_g18008 [Phytophthora cactorum]
MNRYSTNDSYAFGDSYDSYRYASRDDYAYGGQSDPYQYSRSGSRFTNAKKPNRKDYSHAKKPSGAHAKKPAVPPEETPTKPLTEKEQAILDQVNAFLALGKSTVNLNKLGKLLLLKIHPDKCRMENLDAHSLSQKVIIHMNA